MGYGDLDGVVPRSRRFLWRRRSEGATYHGGKAVEDVMKPLMPIMNI